MKIESISGFPEWLPEQKIAEDRLVSKIKKIYEGFGFIPLETPSVELLSSLSSKGVIEKEIYVIKRYHAEESEEAQLALHFDLTVPLARYVGQHFANLTFPFKRYQLQRSWRGEKPQRGRFREFYQFDIDTIALDNLPLSCDSEILAAVDKVFATLNLGKYVIKVNNRKLLLGFFSALGLEGDKAQEAIRIVDKLDKIGEAGVSRELGSSLGLDNQRIERIMTVSRLKLAVTDIEKLRSELLGLGVDGDLFRQGVDELCTVFSLLSPASRTNVRLELSVARGLDYYTGIVIETYLTDYAQFGAVCSGGRYEDLASQFINKKLPGVGVSIGVTRLLSLLFENNLLDTTEKTPSKVLVTVDLEENRAACNALAETLRGYGVACEVYYKSPKFGKQIEYADRKGIRYCMFISAKDGAVEVKDLKTKEQSAVADLRLWSSNLLAG